MVNENPCDLDAERHLLGALMLVPSMLTDVAIDLEAGDFYPDSHKLLFDTLCELYAGANLPGGDAMAVLNHFKRLGVTTPSKDEIIGIMSAANAGRKAAELNAATILRLSVARRVAAAASDIRNVALTAKDDPAELVDLAHELIGHVKVPVADKTVGLSTVDEFISATDTTPAPWVIPNMMRRGWRAMIVGGEGVGKAVTMRQIAGAAAQGIHPFAMTAMDPIRTLLVDVENPADAIVETADPIARTAQRHSKDYDPDRAQIWHRPGGMNLRNRSDRLHLEAVLHKAKPDLVAAGPLYKLYRVDKGESDEQAAGEVQQILDDLRTRHGFALVLEHHAPKGSLMAREMTPYGSSLWLRWPELGIALQTKPDGGRAGSLGIARWRRDRVVCQWPTRIDRGRASDWPWRGVYPEGDM